MVLTTVEAKKSQTLLSIVFGEFLVAFQPTTSLSNHYSCYQSMFQLKFKVFQSLFAVTLSSEQFDFCCLHSIYFATFLCNLGRMIRSLYHGQVYVLSLNQFLKHLVLYWPKRYLDQLGMASTFGHKVFCRQSLIGGNYGLLNTTTFVPNPDYYRLASSHYSLSFTTKYTTNYFPSVFLP